MKDKLRELAERWKTSGGMPYTRASDQGYASGLNGCADELLAILDAEGDGGAVGEKVCIDAVGRIEIDMTGDIGINWVLEGGIHALEEGTWILCADREVTDDEGYGELYTHPARSGVVSDEDVSVVAKMIADRVGNGMREKYEELAKHIVEHFAKGECHER